MQWKTECAVWNRRAYLVGGGRRAESGGHVTETRGAQSLSLTSLSLSLSLRRSPTGNTLIQHPLEHIWLYPRTVSSRVHSLVCLCMWVYMYLCVYIDICIGIYRYLYLCMYGYICVYICVYVYGYIGIAIYILVYIGIYI